MAESEVGQESAVQGFNFVVPVRTVRKFLDDAGVRVEGPGRFDEAWHAGLRQFFRGSYAAAALSLERADRLVPGLPDVVRLAAETRDRIRNPPPRPFPWVWLGAALTALGAAGYGVLLASRRRRDRYRIRPAEVMRLMESGDPPAILDVRDAAAYSRSPFRIPGAVHVPPEALTGGLGSVPVQPNRAVVAYCT